MTKTQQEKTLDEGLALGTAMLGVEQVQWELIATEGNFRRAWQRWNYSGLFPAIRVDLARHDLQRILKMSDRRMGARCSGWTGSGPFLPWTDGDDWEGIARVVSEDIPAGAWQALAREWLDKPESARTFT